MFERFTKDARRIVVLAQEEAAAQGAAEITPLHLLVAMLGAPEGSAAVLLQRIGVEPGPVAAEARRVRDRGGISAADAEALGELGIDVEAILGRIEEQHGPDALAGSGRTARGRVRFAGASKKTLELCLQEVVRTGGKELRAEHLLVALAAQRGPASDVLARFDVDAPRLRQALS